MGWLLTVELRPVGWVYSGAPDHWTSIVTDSFVRAFFYSYIFFLSQPPSATLELTLLLSYLTKYWYIMGDQNLVTLAGEQLLRKCQQDWR